MSVAVTIARFEKVSHKRVYFRVELFALNKHLLALWKGAYHGDDNGHNMDAIIKIGRMQLVNDIV